MQVNGGTDFDTFKVIGTSGSDLMAAGAVGVDSDVNVDYLSESATPDADATLKSVETVEFDGGDGEDTLSTNGGFGTGAQYTQSAVVDGGSGGDTIVGGGGSNVLRGGSGNDTLISPGVSFAKISPGTGDDTALAGSGTGDVLDYSDAPGGVSVDLTVTAPQDTGSAGKDTVSGFERLDGSPFDDRLTGSEGENVIWGRAGADVLMGRGGDDLLIGASSLADATGIDTVSYAEPSPGVTKGVTFSVAIQGADQDTGSEGVDRVAGIANVVGSPYPDTLTGDAQANRIDAGGGADIVDAAAGADTLLLRDSVGDSADCGGEGDTVQADEQGLDTLTGCESVDFSVLPPAAQPDPQTQTQAQPGPGTGPAADGSLTFEVRAARRQRLGKRGTLSLTPSCPQEPCVTTIRARLSVAGKARGARARTLAAGARSLRLGAGKGRAVAFRLSAKAARRARAGLRSRRRVIVTVTAVAADAAGNRRTVTRIIRLRG